ncbi:MAG: hypothetical protein JNM42_01470 [Propionivibrio sp.]|uniref:hypothetical protein n=1 Tax=Propionivibrio sp. TaxID=2212460 RepID=UPI001A611FBE|nr:hypothetical protein [Propionivibrio sp.]MBL8413089.1 hypothetical protein [Propionivibrio sp.]
MNLTNRFLHALLVACDQSYKTTVKGVAPDDFLNYYLDTENGDPYSDQMPSSWFADLSDWRVDRRFDDPDTGFGATVYSKPVTGQPGKFDYIEPKGSE